MADSTTSIEDDVVTAGLIALGAAAVAAAIGVWWALRHPRTTLGVAIPIVTLLAVGPAATVALLAGLVAALASGELRSVLPGGVAAGVGLRLRLATGHDHGRPR